MPAWWYMFAFTIFMAIIGTLVYKNRRFTYANVNSKLEDENSKLTDNKSIGLFFALMTFSLVVFYAGQRSWVYDTYQYMDTYQNLNANDLSYVSSIIRGDITVKGPGFTILMCLFKHYTGGDYNAWFTFIAIIQGVCLARFLQKYSNNFLLSVYLLFTSGVLVWMFNGMRQFLALCIIIAFTDWIIERKTISFVLVVLLAYTVHSSAIVFVPVYFICFIKPWSKKSILFILLFVITIYIFTQTSILGDDNEYSYLSTDQAGTVGVNPVRVIFNSVPFILALISRKKYEQLSIPPIILICINMSLITCGCYIVGMFTNGVMGRIPIYFQLYNYLLIPWLLKNGFIKSTSKLILYGFVTVYFLYFIYDAYISGNYYYQSANLHLFYEVNY